MQYGAVAENDDSSYYRFTLDTSGTIDLSMNAYMEWIQMYLYDSEGVEVWHSNPRWNSVLEMINFKESIYLTGGTYYF